MTQDRWKNLLNSEWLLVVYILAILVVLWAVTGMDISKNVSRAYDNLVHTPTLKAEITFRDFIFDMKTYFIVAHVTNLNDFNWTDVKIYADGTNRCHLQPDVQMLQPGESVTIESCVNASGQPVGAYDYLLIKTAENQNGLMVKVSG